MSTTKPEYVPPTSTVPNVIGQAEKLLPPPMRFDVATTVPCASRAVTVP